MPKISLIGQNQPLTRGTKKAISISFTLDGDHWNEPRFAGHDRQIFLSQDHHNILSRLFYEVVIPRVLVFEESLKQKLFDGL